MTDQFVMGACRPGTDKCCRYLVMGSKGWGCAKLTEMKALLDSRVVKGEMHAIGDNCKGRIMR